MIENNINMCYVFLISFIFLFCFFIIPSLTTTLFIMKCLVFNIASSIYSIAFHNKYRLFFFVLLQNLVVTTNERRELMILLIFFHSYFHCSRFYTQSMLNKKNKKGPRCQKNWLFSLVETFFIKQEKATLGSISWIHLL